jgi:hypothetical protein
MSDHSDNDDSEIVHRNNQFWNVTSVASRVSDHEARKYLKHFSCNGSIGRRQKRMFRETGWEF